MAINLTNDDRKKWAQWIYRNEDLSYGDIALTVGVDIATVRNWAQEGDWSGVKRSMLTSKKAQLELLYAALETTTNKMKDGEPVNAKEIDLALKYTSAIKNLEIEASVSQIIEVFELFVLWLQRRNLPLTQKVIEYLDAFVKHREAA